MVFAWLTSEVALSIAALTIDSLSFNALSSKITTPRTASI
jgi:hypothetical protein